MMSLNPLLLVGGVIGTVSVLLLIAYACVKDKKTAMGFERSMADGEILRRLFGYAKPYLKQFVVVGFLVLFSISYDIASPLIVGYIEELVVGDFELKSLYVSVAVYAGVLVFSMASTYLQAVILQRVGQRIISDLREDLFTHIESLSHGQLNDIPVGKLVTRVTNDTNAISMMFTNLFVNLTKNAFVILGILVAMLFLNYELTLMVLCFVPFILLFTVIFRKFSRRAYRKVKDATTDINTYLSENLSGIKVTQIFGREDEKMEEFRQKSQTLAKATQEQIFVFGVFRPLVYMLYISSILCLFYLGGMGHLNHVTFLGQTISSGTIVTFYMYISKFFTPIQNLAEQFNWLQSALASSEKVFSIMDIQPQMVDAPDAVELDEVKGDIEFRDVWFSYIPGEWVLQGVSFHVEPRQTVAFVGSTGSGKSTILSLICRNYEFQKGEILIDGIDIRKIKISSLRRHFGQMLQDVFLFSGTIRSNIVLREENIPDEEIMKSGAMCTQKEDGDRSSSSRSSCFPPDALFVLRLLFRTRTISVLHFGALFRPFFILFFGQHLFDRFVHFGHPFGMRTALPLTAVGFVSLFRTVGFLRTVGFHLRRVGPHRTIRFHLFEIGEEYPADL